MKKKLTSVMILSGCPNLLKVEYTYGWWIFVVKYIKAEVVKNNIGYIEVEEAALKLMNG